MELRIVKHYQPDCPNSWSCEDGLGYFYMLKLQTKETILTVDGVVTMWVDVPIAEEI